MAAILVLEAGFVGLCAKFFANTQDDAYITLRYSKHLVDGYGLVWNPGGPAIEGYTSFLWVLIGAVPHALGWPPFLFVKLLSVFSGMACIGLVFVFARANGVSTLTTAVATTFAALNPAFAFITIQGMETAVSALLILVAVAVALPIVRRPGAFNPAQIVVLYGSLFLAMLSPPDAAVFAAVLLAGLAAVVLSRHGVRRARALTAYGIALLFVPGVAYLVWKLFYFGALFPNPFYVKRSDALVSLLGGYYSLTFVTTVLGPLLVLAAYQAISHSDHAKLLDLVPAGVAIAAFLSMWAFIEPMTGFLWRFQMPVLPAAILVASLVFREVDPTDWVRRGSSASGIRFAMALALLLVLVASPMMTYRDATAHHENDSPEVDVGRALGSLEQYSYAMFVTEGGALPYYSGWRAMDEWGLNSEYIAHHGLDIPYLDRFDPDLVMISTTIRPGMVKKKSRPLAEYLDDSSFRLVAAIAPDDTHVHLYFVDATSPGYDTITCRIRHVEHLTYLDPADIAPLIEIDVELWQTEVPDCANLPPAR